MQIDVQNDTLRGTPISGGLETDAVPGWVLFLGPPVVTTIIPQYKLTITGVNYINFWTQPSGQFPAYTFKAESLTDQCDIEICKPDLSSNTDFPGISGTAVIFRGDLYGDKTYTVRSSPSDPDDMDSDVFNIACLGTAISKLHLLRHTSASHASSSSPSDPMPPTFPQRQTMLKLLTADYCGNGHPFTIDGLPIKLGFNNAPYQLAAGGSKYNMQLAASIDALWNSDGATCIDTPRLWKAKGTGPDLATIQGACSNVKPIPHQLPACTSPVSLNNPFAMLNYAISGNP